MKSVRGLTKAKLLSNRHIVSLNTCQKNKSYADFVADVNLFMSSLMNVGPTQFTRGRERATIFSNRHNSM